VFPRETSDEGLRLLLVGRSSAQGDGAHAGPSGIEEVTDDIRIPVTVHQGCTMQPEAALVLEKAVEETIGRCAQSLDGREGCHVQVERAAEARIVQGRDLHRR